MTLEQNYRSTQPILDAANAVIALAAERFTKNLFSHAAIGRATAAGHASPTRWRRSTTSSTRVLEAREAGVPLKRQAVLFRAAHHSDALEVELGRRNIPFVKYGGLKFLEAAHVKDALCVLRWAENLRDRVAAFRVRSCCPGLGRAARSAPPTPSPSGRYSLDALARSQARRRPRATIGRRCARSSARLRGGAEWMAQLGLVRRWYQPHLERIYDRRASRARRISSSSSRSLRTTRRASASSPI